MSAQTQQLFNGADTNGFYYEFLSPYGDVLKRSTNAPGIVSLPKHSASSVLFQMRTSGPFREAWHFTEKGECALVGRNISADLAAMRRFSILLLAAGGVVLALGLAGSVWLITRALRPLEKISATASRITAGNLSERINLAEVDSELGLLADTLNATFARLEATFAQQKQFTADAAHELRTPVTVMLTHAQNGLSSECVSEEHREAFEACQRAGQRMRHLIESLLELMDLDTGQETIKRKPFDLALVAADCAELIKPLAVLRGITIRSELAPCFCDGDAQRIAQVVSNLLANAIHYNKTDGEVQISTRAQNGSAILTVRDTGCGILAEDLPHIFERFYRADKSRSSAGRGLGLAISKAIIQAHGGVIRVQSVPEEGSEFQIILPRHDE